MNGRIGFFLRRLRERLWVRPVAYGLLAVCGAFVAYTADYTDLDSFVPNIAPDTIEKLLSIISATMLAVATFAVASMISAYGSASRSATPRAFSLVVADDVSQKALSSFIGAFIFSIIAIIALKTGTYGHASRFVLFVLTLVVFVWVIATFVRWVDNIARLGRVGTTIEKVESAAEKALTNRRRVPAFGGVVVDHDKKVQGEPVYGDKIGYVQHFDMRGLQFVAEKCDARIVVAALPGTFLAPGRPLAYVKADKTSPADIDTAGIRHAFFIADDRTFDNDPRFGLIVLSEIAARALSPAVNDPGTAIVIIGKFVRLFAGWVKPADDEHPPEVEHDRVHVPAISLNEMFDDAFTAIARDGAGVVEVGIRLQKAFASLAALGNAQLTDAAQRHSKLALARAEQALHLPTDINRIRDLAKRQGLISA